MPQQRPSLHEIVSRFAAPCTPEQAGEKHRQHWEQQRQLRQQEQQLTLKK